MRKLCATSCVYFLYYHRWYTSIHSFAFHDAVGGKGCQFTWRVKLLLTASPTLSGTQFQIREHNLFPVSYSDTVGRICDWPL